MIKKAILLSLCLPVLAFGAAACGSDDDSNSDSTTSSSESADTAATDTEATTSEGQQDIVQLAMATDDLSTLVEAVAAADLVETLQGEGPFTVFAPTNAAFAELPPAELKRLLKPTNKDELANILTYHVVPGDVKAADLSDGQTVETVQGEKLKVKVDGDTVTVNGATVAQADVVASNGVVHVIDTVLIPKN